MANGKIVRTKMAEAFERARLEANRVGHNPGYVGKRILTNNAKGIGVIYRERLTLKKRDTAETAGNVGVAA